MGRFRRLAEIARGKGWTVRAVLGVVILGVLGTGPSPAPAVAQTVAAMYYVNDVGGNDANPGTSPAFAWRTLARAQVASLPPGSALLLRRGGSWEGKLTLSSSRLPGAPIVVSSYGVGALPRLKTGGCLDLLGSYITVEFLHVDGCRWGGVSVSGSYNVVRNIVATENVAGIYVRSGSVGNQILGNELRNNNRMSVLTAVPAGDDSGAWGILLNGDDNEVAYNVISGSDAFSYDYVRDGAAVEIYGGRGNRIHHNRAVDNNMFSELGNSRSAGNVFSYNAVVSQLERGGFLTTRGAASRYGPVLATQLYNNSVLLKGALSEGIVCHAGCGPHILRMRNNVIQAVRKAGYADFPFDDGNGLYFGGRIQFVVGLGSQVAPPQFADPAAGDLHLLRSSPGIDRGDLTGVPFRTDLDGRRTPADGNGDGVAVLDIGAYELVLRT